MVDFSNLFTTMSHWSLHCTRRVASCYVTTHLCSQNVAQVSFYCSEHSKFELKNVYTVEVPAQQNVSNTLCYRVSAVLLRHCLVKNYDQSRNPSTLTRCKKPSALFRYSCHNRTYKTPRYAFWKFYLSLIY